MRDRASVNEVAIKTLRIVYPNLVSVGCFSHTINHVGEQFCKLTLTEFIVSWISLFLHRPKCRIGRRSKQRDHWAISVLLNGGADERSWMRCFSTIW